MLLFRLQRTILKKSYFGYYIDNIDCLHDQLEELLTNRKNYHSLIKRREDFQEIDENVIKVIERRTDELQESIDSLKSSEGEVKSEGNRFFNIEGYLQGIREILEAAISREGCDMSDRDGFILFKIKRNLFEIIPFDIVFHKMIEKLGCKEGELLCAEKEPSTGIKKDLLFYKILPDGSEKHIPLNQISNIADILLRDLKFSPVFYMYIN